MTDLSVSGFEGNLLALNGVYSPNGSLNHGRPVYKNMTTSNQVVLMYFWDASNGPELHGWWLAPEVGSQQAWATGPANNDMAPPTSGWRHPWNGPVDAKIQVGRSGVKRPLDQQTAQQQQPRYDYAQGYGAQGYGAQGYGMQGYQRGQGYPGYAQGYGQRFGGANGQTPAEYKTDDTELVAAEKALEKLTNELKDEPIDYKQTLATVEELEPLVQGARTSVQGGNVHPAWTARAHLVSQSYHSSRRQLETAIRLHGEENAKKLTLMLKKAQEATEKAQENPGDIEEALTLYDELTAFYDAEDQAMDILFAAPHLTRPFAFSKHAPTIRKLRDRLQKLGGLAAGLAERPETVEDVAEKIREEVKGNDLKTNNMIATLEGATIEDSLSPEDLLESVYGWSEKHKEIEEARLGQKKWITESLEKIKDATHPESAAVAARREVLRSRDKSNLVDMLLTKLANKIKEGQDLLRQKIDEAIAAALRSRHTFQHTNEGPMTDILNSIGMPVTTEKLLDRYTLPELKKVLATATAKGISLSQEWPLSDFKNLIFPAYMVVKPTNLTTVFEVKTARAVQKLMPGHTIIQLDEPTTEEDIGAVRMRASALDTGNLGFATLKGNQGTVFLKRYTGYFKVIHEHGAILRIKEPVVKTLEPTEQTADAPAEEMVKLKRTQLLQAIGHPKVNAIAKKATLKVRIVDDAQEGEVTLCQGDSWFLEIASP